MITNFFFQHKDKILYPNSLQERYVKFLLTQIQREKNKRPTLEILNILMNLERKLSLLISIYEPQEPKEEEIIEENTIEEVQPEMPTREKIVLLLKNLKNNIEKETI